MSSTNRSDPFVDAHVHLWDTRAFALPWLTAAVGLASRYDEAELRATADPRPRLVVVQAGETRAEWRWLARQAQVAGSGAERIVRQLVPGRPGWDRFGRARAVRLNVRGLPDRWGSVPGLASLLRRAAARGIPIDVLARPAQLADLLDLAQRHPDLTLVLTHLGLAEQPPRSTTIDRGWAHSLALLGTQPAVLAKVSGLFGLRIPPKALRDAVEVAFAAFGPHRLMFGSDWPISTLVHPYPETVERTTDLLPRLTGHEADAFWAGTATRCYGLAPPSRD